MLSDIRHDNSPAGQILRLLQHQGRRSIKEIEAELGVTTTAVRQQLTSLVAAGLVTTDTVREKRGRPHAVYNLSDKGHELFALGSMDLAHALLGEVLRLGDPGLAQQLLSRVSTRLGRRYAEQMNGVAVQERLHDLADWLRVHGIPSKVDEEADAFVFTEYGCPYYGLAREHREVCDMEIEALELALGSPVTLCQSQLDGHHGCQFQVKKPSA